MAPGGPVGGSTGGGGGASLPRGAKECASSARRTIGWVLRIRVHVFLWRSRWWLALLAVACVWRTAVWASGHWNTPQRDSSTWSGGLGTSLVSVEWAEARALLAEADALRRADRAVDAIHAYSKVIQAPGARLQDLQSARAWRARLCFQRGEASALDELMALAQDQLPPQLYAHVASTVTHEKFARDVRDSSVTSAAVFEAVIHQLERASRVRSASGERAKGWLQRVRTKGASFFSQ